MYCNSKMNIKIYKGQGFMVIMTNENMTKDERVNLDKLDFFFQEKIRVHLKLRRTNNQGKSIFLNGLIKEKLTDTLFLLEDKVLGDVRVSLFELRDDGVSEEKRRGESNE